MEPQKQSISFAEKLNYLFQTITKPDGSEYTHEEVYQATGITVGYISKLRTGKAESPGYRVIQALATFFHISPAYFFEFDPELSELPHPVDAIALRASQLSLAGRRVLLDMLEHILMLEEEAAKKKGHE